MTSPRKRTLAAVLLLAATVTLGTANSSEAARRQAKPAKKSHSTTVKKNQTSRRSSKVLSSARGTSGSSRSAAQHLGAIRSRLSQGTASQTAKKSTTVRSVRVATKGTKTTRSTAARRSDEMDIRAALARREAWNSEGRFAVNTGKLQDAPADTIGETEPERILARNDEPKQMAYASDANDDLIRAALRKRGTPYVWGGASRGGFDCSGFVCYIFEHMRGMKLPHSASQQSRLGAPVPKDELQPGDLVFFSTYRPGVSHVGIYVGENKFVHAANSRRGTRVDTLTGYYGRRYKWARRLAPAPIKFTNRDLEQLNQDRSEIPQEGP